MNRPATKNTISDIVIATVNRLRAGDVPAELLALLTEMRDNCGDEPMVTSVGGAIHRYTVKADVEAARATVLRAGAALPALAKSIRAKCGTASPTKPIGPQKAVTVPDSNVVARKINVRVRPTFSPIVRA